jgi:putative DNA primase/helicase
VTELAAHMAPVAKLLFGEPNRQLSNGKELRYGNHGSLSVDLDAGTWFDHEGKVGGGVLDLVRRQLRCDRGAALDWLRENAGLAPAPERPKRAKRRVVARYVYTDAEGRPLYRVLRWEPKSFSQERYEDGGWVGGRGAMRGVDRTLYRLPEVLAADQVVIVEGEKDADNLRAAGLVATTNAEGAEKWQARFAAILAGKRTVVIPDNDDTGRKHAARIAASLRGKAASVKVLALDGLPEKGDVSDWLDQDHTADELRALIAEAPEWEPPPEVEEKPGRPPEEEEPPDPREAAEDKRPPRTSGRSSASTPAACTSTPSRRRRCWGVPPTATRSRASTAAATCSCGPAGSSTAPSWSGPASSAHPAR